MLFPDGDDQIDDDADVEQEEREPQGSRFLGDLVDLEGDQRAGGDHDEIAGPGVFEDQADSLDQMQDGVKECAGLDGSKVGRSMPVSLVITS